MISLQFNNVHVKKIESVQKRFLIKIKNFDTIYPVIKP